MTRLPEPRQGGALSRPTVRVLNQALHLFAAAVSVGVPFFLAVIAIPRLEAEGAGDSVPAVVDRFYSIFPWITLAVFLTTGLVNYLLWLAGSGYSPKESLGTSYVKALLVKVALANVLIGLGIAFGFSGAMQEDARPWLWALFAIGAAIILISAGLRRSPTPLGRAGREVVPQVLEKGPLEAKGGS